MNHEVANMKVGESIKLKLIGAPKAKFRSNNKKVATVTKKGIVKTKRVGFADVYTIMKNKKYLCIVNVIDESSDKGVKTSVGPLCKGNHIWDNDKIQKNYKPLSNGGHEIWNVVKCKYCHVTKETKAGTEPCNYSDDYTVVKEPTCIDSGRRVHWCVNCWGQESGPGIYETQKMWDERTTLKPLGHDLEYTYKREISVHPGWSDRRYPEASKNAVESPFGERTATCKRCHKSFEEVGIDTGTELNDGTREIVWGVWRQDKNSEIVDEINSYRTLSAGPRREALQESETLNRAAVYILAEKLQMWTKYGTPGNIKEIYDNKRGRRGRIREMVSSNFLITSNCYDVGYINGIYDVNQFSECSLMNPAFKFNTDIQYMGVAYFDIERDDGSFQPGVIAVGKQDENLEYVCNHACSGSNEFGPTSYYYPGEADGLYTVPCKKCEFEWKFDPDDPYRQEQ